MKEFYTIDLLNNSFLISCYLYNENDDSMIGIGTHISKNGYHWLKMIYDTTQSDSRVWSNEIIKMEANFDKKNNKISLLFIVADTYKKTIPVHDSMKKAFWNAQSVCYSKAIFEYKKIAHKTDKLINTVTGEGDETIRN